MIGALLFAGIILTSNSVKLRGQISQFENPYAYLFSHRTSDKYGRLYYSISMDGALVMNSTYWGHSVILEVMTGSGSSNRNGKMASNEIPLWQ